jgi:hypothetical protein
LTDQCPWRGHPGLKKTSTGCQSSRVAAEQADLRADHCMTTARMHWMSLTGVPGAGAWIEPCYSAANVSGLSLAMR